MTDDIVTEMDHAIAVITHLSSIEPNVLVDVVLEQIAREQPLNEEDRLLAGNAVLLAYNAIVGGAAFASAAA